MKREDEIHPYISGNKFRKLKYNLLEAKAQGKQSLLTFGGAFSNHIAAVAEASRLLNFKSIGIIRGEELGRDLLKTLAQNTTLNRAYEAGMQFYFVSRTDYRLKSQLPQVKSIMTHQNPYIIPEGGTNQFAVKGCQEILTKNDHNFNVITCALGTSGTFAGLIEAAQPHQNLIGFPALKGNFFSRDISKYTTKSNWQLEHYHFGGYAKYTPELIHFINSFKHQYGIALDPIYTGKMMFGLFEMIKSGQFSKNTRILAIHTGGLQAIKDFNRRLALKKHPQLI